jgi:nitrate reductase gamma subunit
VREGVLVGLFASVGVGQELSTAMSLLGYIAGILASLLGGIAFVVRRSQAAQESAET